MKLMKILPMILTISLGLIYISATSAQSSQDVEQMNKINDKDMNAQHYTEVADNYLRYLNEKNLEGILSLYADTATVEDPVGSKVLMGMEALRKFYTGAVNIDLKLMRIGQVRVAGVEIAFPFQLIMNYEDVPMITDIIDVFRFDEAGKIVSMRAFWGPTNRRVFTE